MYRQYIRQAWQLMKQNRFFSVIYIIGTGLAISMVMVMAVVYHIRTANLAPETNRNRMCYVDQITYRYNVGNNSTNSFLGSRLAKETFLSLNTPEAVAITTSFFLPYVIGDCFLQLPGGEESLKTNIMGCNDGFWRVYDFHFLEGKPFTDADFQSAVPRLVLCERKARELFGRTDIVGQMVLLNEVEYTVCGVVSDVSRITPDVFAELWLPYSTLLPVMGNQADECSASTGVLQANVLLRDASDFPAFNRELAESAKRYNTMLAEGKVEIGESVQYAQRTVEDLFSMDVNKTFVVLGIVLALFLLVPALNLSGLNTSHMQDRIAELGVRKAFGARRSVLFWQIFVENMMLMLPGGIAGLLFSYILIYLLKGLLLSGGLLAIMVGETDHIHLSTGMLLNLEVFSYAFLICLLLNLLSSLIPVWRAIRVNITDALHS